MARQRRQQSFWFYVILLVLFIYLFFRFGLSVFIDWAFLITQKRVLIKPTPSISGQRVALISEPILEEMPDATNEAILLVKGKANPETQIQLFHNQQRVSTINADLDGRFEFEQVLEERNNQFYVKSIDPYSRKSAQSKFYNVTFIDEPPNLEISSPEDGKKYYEPSVLLEGQTDKEVFVRINNIPVVIKADGSFTYNLNLNKGDNQIEVVATDVAGNTTQKSLKLIYVD